MQRKKGTYPLNQSPLYKLSTKRKLANLLGITLQELQTFKDPDRLYSERDIPKKTGGTRRIENPRRNLKIVQARIARLMGRITPPGYLFCPVKGRSYVTNAACHISHRVVRTLDIKKYFPSTTRDRVYRFFRGTLRCNPDVANLLTDVATYKRHLPTGSPLSPIMAFYAHFDVWEEVYRLVNAGGGVNSLYIDDLTISGDRVREGLIWEIKKVIYGAGLRYHKEKTFRGRPAEVTGVIIRNGQLAVPNRQLLKKHRAELAVRKAATQIEQEMLFNQLRGLSSQIAQIKASRRPTV
jgi:retron-type reverse transcriptase